MAIRQLVIALTALGLSACGQMGGGDDASFDGSIEDRAKFVAANTQRALPEKRGDITITAIRAEGHELVFDAEMSLTGVGSITAEALTKQLRPRLCNEGLRGFIEKGGVMRLDVRDPKTGKRLRPGPGCKLSRRVIHRACEA